MSEQNNNNIEEGIEENNNQNNPEEYEGENYNQDLDEEGQEFAVAFDIQINDGSFILLIGKTEENKLILRLVDKDDKAKSFFQNEFSLEELKEINNYFENFTNENDAIDSVIKNLNENDKEIEILDDNNIKLTVQINEGEENGTNVDFILPKLSFEFEEEQEQENYNDNDNNIKKEDNGMNIQNEGEGEEEIENIEDINEEGIEEVGGYNENDKENYIDNEEHIEEANLEYSDENGEKNGQIISHPIQEQNIDNNLQIPEEQINTQQNIVPGYINDNKKQNELQIIVEETNENKLKEDEINEKDKNLNININQINSDGYQKEEIEKKNIENDNNNNNGGEETKISRVIEELKNNLDSLGGAMNYIEQNEEEQQQEPHINENENNAEIKKEDNFDIFKNEILKTINKLSENFNQELKKQINLIMFLLI